MKTIFIQSYDIAVEIAEKHKDSKFYSAAVQFLKDCKASEQLTGDDDSPFNSDVHDFIQIEEQFRKDLDCKNLMLEINQRDFTSVKAFTGMFEDRKLSFETVLPLHRDREDIINWAIKMIAFPEMKQTF